MKCPVCHKNILLSEATVEAHVGTGDITYFVYICPKCKTPLQKPKEEKEEPKR